MNPVQLPAAVRREVASAADIQTILANATAQLPVATPVAAPPVVAAPPPVTPVVAVVPPAPPPPIAVPQSQDVAIRALIQQNETLANSLRDMQAQLIEAVKPKAPDAPVVAPGTDPRDKEVFGEDVIAMVDRKVMAALEQVRNIAFQINERITKLETNVGVVSNKAEYTVERQFITALGAAVPDYETVNAEVGWHKWLGEVDPMIGEQRQTLLNAATRAFDAKRTAAIFNAYKATRAPAAAAPPAANELESQLAPAASAAAAPPAAAEIPYLKESQISSFYNDVARNRYAGREDEKNQIDALINQVVAAGRVIPGQ